jgi:hypothetical protein
MPSNVELASEVNKLKEKITLIESDIANLNDSVEILANAPDTPIGEAPDMQEITKRLDKVEARMNIDPDAPAEKIVYHKTDGDKPGEVIINKVTHKFTTSKLHVVDANELVNTKGNGWFNRAVDCVNHVPEAPEAPDAADK